MKKYTVITLINKLVSEEEMTLQEARDYIKNALDTRPDYLIDGGFQIIDAETWLPVKGETYWKA